MNAHDELLETLNSSEMLRDYERAYTEVTGLPIALRPLNTWQLPLHGKRHENSFCAIMAEKSRSCAACLLMQEELGKKAMTEPATVTCTYGLCETAVPVKLGNQTIGLLQTGQVMRQKPTPASFQRAVDKAKELGLDIDDTRTRDAFLATPVVSSKKLEAAEVLLNVFADHLSIKSNQIAVQQAHAEPPMITKAKQFILDQIAEDLSLAQVAAAVHTSVFYFCKQFHRYTGTTFTEFVSRTRVEKAKGLLLNPNLRVSEIAYEVGFQSLTHFNRVFKHVVGESPSDYRTHLKIVLPKSPRSLRQVQIAVCA
ncbi:MAG: transcriptional regulator, AraC family [Verrucomicrobia bacterium]|jgi:AraC-like DNA-binding protein/ligand-binding sensor protein|nr:transcriptional regulator, AraC family [Verrucomicrobiota bacterium]